ncbi:isoaspartyl peptidase/L-asparaginase [uncultured Hyphomonas sp.]|uniref:isoaspartyl peptidase/L-asparaginase family protein n=1 Tax=uncultured Hyphomonas sp. TaxID=225298 RepID=UPI002AAA688F|nr:isoaspartyl peptidase/L-asparaginase [uncultured Hyphomonas sp.]
MIFRPLFAAAVILLAGCQTSPVNAEPVETPQWRLAIHGGAGVITRGSMTPEQEALYRAGLQEALEAGAEVLRNGGSALDAAQAAVIPMENNEIFNAGKGAVFTAAATHELDASIMEGSTRNAGAVAGVTVIKNPILAARAVMDKSEHVMFAGPGADAFAVAQGLETVPNTYFDTERRRKSLERVLETLSRTAADKHGTVGAVAIDADGNIAAATTTGGMTAKTAGRVGDSPMIGAATYAENGVCGVSATGHGEYFIRVGVAKTICDRVKLAGESVGEAAQVALDEVAELGGDGGVVLIGGDGEVDFVFNSEGMYRGWIDADGSWTAIYGDEAETDE